MGDRLWPARRWLADRLIGDHAYSRNVADYRDFLDYQWQVHTSNYAHDAGYRIKPRNPGETA